jgi:hypothetical protein
VSARIPEVSDILLGVSHPAKENSRKIQEVSICDDFAMPKSMQKATVVPSAAGTSADDGQAFLQSLISTLQKEEQVPKYKRARTFVENAVSSVPAGELRDQLEEHLPAALAQLKQALSTKRQREETPPPPAAPLKRVAHQPNTFTDANYLEAVATCSDEQLPALILARAPPCELLLQRLLPASPEAMHRAATTATALVAASGSADIAPVIEAVCRQAHRHLVHLSDEICSMPHNGLTSSTLDPSHVSAATRDAHSACCTLLRRLAAILAARTASHCAHSAPEGPHTATIMLCLLSCAARMYSTALQGRHVTLEPHICASLVSSAVTEAEVLLHGVPREAIARFLANHRAHTAGNSPPITAHHLHPLAWLALHAASETLAPSPKAQPVTLAEVVMQRHCGQLLDLTGDVAAGASAAAALLSRCCGSELLQWLQVQTAVPRLAERCRSAVLQVEGSAAAAVVAYLVEELSFEECVTLLEAEQEGNGGTGGVAGEGGVQEAQSDDEELFSLDKAGMGNVFGGVWEACSEEEDGDGRSLVDVGEHETANNDVGSSEAEE